MDGHRNIHQYEVDCNRTIINVDTAKKVVGEYAGKSIYIAVDGELVKFNYLGTREEYEFDDVFPVDEYVWYGENYSTMLLGTHEQEKAIESDTKENAKLVLISELYTKIEAVKAL